MALTDELEKIKALGLSESAFIIEAFMGKPEVRLYIALGKIVDQLVKEIDKIDSSSILMGDDKLFERVNTIIVKYTDYKQAFENGRSGIVEIDEEESESPFARKNGRNNTKEKK